MHRAGSSKPEDNRALLCAATGPGPGHMDAADDPERERIMISNLSCARFSASVALISYCALTGLAHAADPMPAESKLQASRSLVQKWMHEHEAERTAIEQAYAKKDAASLSRIANRLQRQQGFPQKGATDLMLDEYAPYLKCDTAFIDLGLLADAMSHQVSRGGASLEKIVKQERADYERSSSVCKKRLAMTPKAAWADYQAE